jgi:hypothetical protein
MMFGRGFGEIVKRKDVKGWGTVRKEKKVTFLARPTGVK